MERKRRRRGEVLFFASLKDRLADTLPRASLLRAATKCCAPLKDRLTDPITAKGSAHRSQSELAPHNLAK
eukprot:5636222-Pyramimonas_sp.AAC.1